MSSYSCGEQILLITAALLCVEALKMCGYFFSCVVFEKAYCEYRLNRTNEALKTLDSSDKDDDRISELRGQVVSTLLVLQNLSVEKPSGEYTFSVTESLWTVVRVTGGHKSTNVMLSYR